METEQAPEYDLTLDLGEDRMNDLITGPGNADTLDLTGTLLNYVLGLLNEEQMEQVTEFVIKAVDQ